MSGQTFEVDRVDWHKTRVVEEPAPDDLEPGRAVLKIDRFAFTSNNITYAAFGDQLAYWRFFPAEDGWGRIPTMGFADVVRSTHADVPEGLRVFGFFPMSTNLLVEPGNVNPHQFVDVASHRREHAPVYRQYSDVGRDPLYDASYEDETLLLRGLFITSFLVDDLIADNAFFGAHSFVISSASSKTAIALAYLLSQRGRGPVIGLTSQRNVAFVERLGYYGRTINYDAVDSLATDEPVVFVDHTGNGDIVGAVHHRFGDRLKYSCMVGATHVGTPETPGDLPGAPPTFFFAPGQMQKRSQDWGPQELQARQGTAWNGFRNASRAWLNVMRGSGPEAVERAYREVLEGRARPDEGHVLSMADG